MSTILRSGLPELGTNEEYINLLESDVAASLGRFYDSKGVDPSGRDEFVCKNTKHITFILNLWVRYMQDLGLEEELSNVLRSSKDPMDVFDQAALRVSDLISTGSGDKVSFMDNMKDKNTLYKGLRFLSRTALTNAPWLEKEGFRKLTQAEKYNRHWCASPDHLSSDKLDWKYRSYWFNQEVLPILREEMRNVFGEGLLDERFDPDDQSTGAVQDACTNRFCKWLRATMPWLPEDYKPLSNSVEGNGEGYFTLPRPHEEWVTTDHTIRKVTVCESNPVYIVTPIVVPKSFKAGRIVAPESAKFIYKQKHFSDQLRERFKARVDDEIVYRRQEESRDLAAEAGYATADQSSASDCIRRSFLKDIAPMKLFNQLYTVMPTHIRINKRVRRMVMFGTMGSPLTFDVLGGTSDALARTACRLANIFDGYGDVLKRPGRKVPNKRKVVGDDIVLPAWAYGWLIAIMEACSLLPNRDKSYSDPHSFREACGFEGFSGEDADVIYATRGVIFDPENSNSVTFDHWKDAWKDPVTSLIALNNALVGCVGVSSRSARYCLHTLRTWIPGFRPDPTMTVQNAAWGYDESYTITSPKILARCDVIRTSKGSRPLGVWVLDKNGDGDTPTAHFVRQPLWLDTSSEERAYPTLAYWERFLVSVHKVVWVTTSPKQGCLCNKLPREFLNAVREKYEYQCFLKYGPAYEDDWCRIVGASSPRIYTEAYRKRPRIVVTTVSTNPF